MNSSRSTQSKISRASVISNFSRLGNDLRYFLKNPIDSRNNYVPPDLTVKGSSRSVMQPSVHINKDAITKEWEKRFAKMKFKNVQQPQTRIVEPYLLLTATNKASDPLHRFTVEEIADLRAKNHSQMKERDTSHLPQLRKIGASLRTNPITRNNYYGS